MGQAIGRALAQMFSIRFLGVMLLGILAAGAIFAGLLLIVDWAVGTLPVLGWAWVNTVLKVLTGLGVLVLSIFLFQPVAVLFIGFFLEFIADAVEARYYPQALAPRSVPIVESLSVSLRFLLLSLFVNILLIPVYFLPVINGLVLVAVNGFLIGREYFELVALRHLSPRQIRALEKEQFFYLLGCGILVAFVLTIPVLNFAGPLFGTAFMVHIFRQINRFADRSS